LSKKQRGALMKQWLTVEDVSAELGVPVETVRSWIRNKKLPAYKPGKHYLIKREDLDKFLEDSRTIPDEEDREK
jgi:excisionase family DNA binding protein